jgi:hypothetical protein
LNALTVCAFINNADDLINNEIKSFLSVYSNAKSSDSAISVMNGLNSLETACKYLLRLKEDSMIILAQFPQSKIPFVSDLWGYS